jgi:hypothetical protein
MYLENFLGFPLYSIGMFAINSPIWIIEDL